MYNGKAGRGSPPSSKAVALHFYSEDALLFNEIDDLELTNCYGSKIGYFCV